MLLTTSVARASPSTSSATITRGLDALATCSSRGSSSRMLEIFLSTSRMKGLPRRPHVVLVGDEVGRQVAAIELHTFDHVELVLQAGAFLDGDHAFLADLLHGLGDDLTDGLVGVGGDRTDLGDRLAVLAGNRCFPDLLDRGGHGLVDAALQVHRVHARGDGLEALVDDGLGQHGRGGGAVTGGVGGLGSDFLDHLRAHVLELVLELDFLGDGDAVLGDGRRAEGLVEDDVAALRAQRGLDGVGQDVHAGQHALAGFVGKKYVFS
jgi:hypothetical protein